MKKSIICMVTAATLFAGIQSAQASDKEKYLIGGLIGGWLLNEVVDGSSVQVRTRRPVRVERHTYSQRPSGRYEYRRVNIWVPGYRERIVTRCGQVQYSWVPGHYEVRREKVWVSYGYGSSHRYGRDRCSSRY